MKYYLVTDEVINRFMSKTVVDDRGCLLWCATVSGKGYGQFSIRLSDGSKTMGIAHRVAYQIYYGDIPEGLHLDHICRVRRCVNPLHLEPVSNWENCRRGKNHIGNQPDRTHCPQGHEYNEENTYRAPGEPNKRKCRICNKERSKIRYARSKA